MFTLGYNTNGFAHHRLEDAVAIIADLGYRGVAVTIERDLLDPPDSRGVAAAVRKLTSIMRGRNLQLTIETGSRFILDPWRKHQPALVSADAAGQMRRVQFLIAAVEIAAEMEAESVSLWSGASDDNAPRDVVINRLTSNLGVVLDAAEQLRVRISFEPEPGMFVDRMAGFYELCEMERSPALGLTLDVGHAYCLDEGDFVEHVRRSREYLWNVHLEDMKHGAHEHLMFGKGEIDFREVFTVLREVDYRGPVNVELSRHSHNAVEAARKSFEFLQQFV